MDISQIPLFAMLSRRMVWLGKRQEILAQNIANADTPGYRRFDLKIDAALQQSQLARTDSRHLTAGGTRAGDYQLERGDFGSRPDRNGVDLDQELITMSRNAGAFEEQAEVLSFFQHHGKDASQAVAMAPTRTATSGPVRAMLTPVFMSLIFR